MRRILVLFAASVLGTAALAGCSSDSKTASTSGTTSGTTSATTAGGGGITVPTATGTPVAVTAGDKSDTEQFLTPVPVSVKAGPTTFTFTNTSTTKQHEMIVLKTDTAFDALKVGADDKVSEADSVGEVSETDAGKTGTVTLDLKPGKYVLVCNIAKHYAQGMRAAFTVTG